MIWKIYSRIGIGTWQGYQRPSGTPPSLLCRASFNSSCMPPQWMSAETNGYLRRPITAHFHSTLTTFRNFAWNATNKIVFDYVWAIYWAFSNRLTWMTSISSHNAEFLPSFSLKSANVQVVGKDWQVSMILLQCVVAQLNILLAL